jgi:hypothetical protein
LNGGGGNTGWGGDLPSLVISEEKIDSLLRDPALSRSLFVRKGASKRPGTCPGKISGHRIQFCKAFSITLYRHITEHQSPAES